MASAQLLSFLRCAPPRNRTPLKAQKPLGMGAINAIRCCDSFGLDRMATASDSATTADLCKVRVYAPSLPPIVVPRVTCPPLSLFSRSGHRSPAWRRGAMGSYRCHSHPPLLPSVPKRSNCLLRAHTPNWRMTARVGLSLSKGQELSFGRGIFLVSELTAASDAVVDAALVQAATASSQQVGGALCPWTRVVFRHVPTLWRPPLLVVKAESRGPNTAPSGTEPAQGETLPCTNRKRMNGKECRIWSLSRAPDCMQCARVWRSLPRLAPPAAEALTVSNL